MRYLSCCAATCVLATTAHAIADLPDPQTEEPADACTPPPTEAVVIPGEYEPVETLLLAYPESSPELLPFIADIYLAARGHARTVVLVDTDLAAADFKAELFRVGANPDEVVFERLALESVWIRDYGPRALRSAAGISSYADFRYYPERPLDDQLPTELAASWGVSVVRPPLDLEGGNLLSDGAGGCVTTGWVTEEGGTGWQSQPELQDALARYVGCEHTVIVPTLARENTGHVDMSLIVTGRRRALVGKARPDLDPDNAVRLDAAALRLSVAGWQVGRIPMPANLDDRFRSYTNGVPLNGAVLVPVYRDDNRFERAALRAYRRAFPRRRIIPVDATRLIAWEGAIHCATMTLPR